MIQRTYSIHGIVNFSIEIKSGILKQYFDNTQKQFLSFQVESIGNNQELDFSAEIGTFQASQENDSYILDDNYRIADNYLFFRGRRKYSIWEVEVHDLNNKPHIKISTNFVGNITAPLNIIEFFIQYTLLMKGISLIHASGVKGNGTCYLFPARSGGGKTTIALNLVENGFSYLGDNFICLDNGIARKYISPLNIFSYNLTDNVGRNLHPKQRLSMFIKRLIFTFTKGYIKIFEKIDPATIFKENITEEAEITNIYLLIPKTSIKDQIIMDKISFDEFIQRMRYNMELDLLPFSKLIYSYGYLYPGHFFSQFWGKYVENLQKNLPRGVDISVMFVPGKYNDAVIKDITDFLT